MTTLASHPTPDLRLSPETAGIESMGPANEATPGGEDYGVYVLEGVQHPDGTSGLIFSFNPDVLPMKDKDTQRIARNVRLGLLPLKNKEKQLRRERGEEVHERDLDFQVEASESPVRVLERGKIVDDPEKVADIMFGDYEDDEGFMIMRGWAAIRLNYDTSLIDQSELMKAVNYILSSQVPGQSRELWMQDMSTGANVESLLDPNSVKPGNPNQHVRGWLNKILQEAEAENENTEGQKQRVHRLAASISSVLKAGF